MFPLGTLLNMCSSWPISPSPNSGRYLGTSLIISQDVSLFCSFFLFSTLYFWQPLFFFFSSPWFCFKSGSGIWKHFFSPPGRKQNTKVPNPCSPTSIHMYFFEKCYNCLAVLSRQGIGGGEGKFCVVRKGLERVKKNMKVDLEVDLKGLIVTMENVLKWWNI